MYTREETITPEIAKKYLEKNTKNYRIVNHKRVTAYAKDMETGNWQYNGDPIRFYKSGILADGQHRLLAVIKSNSTLVMQVAYDVDDDVTFFDGGQGRTPVQIMKANGFGADIANGAVIGAANLLLSTSFVQGSVTSKGQVQKYLADNAEAFSKANVIARSGKDNAITRKAPCIAAIYCMIRLYEFQNFIYPFFDVVNSGFPVNGHECSAPIVLRNFLISANYNRLSADKRGKTIFAVTYQAITDFSASKSRRKAYIPDFNYADKKRLQVLALDNITL